ncbi:MAG: metallopeptidase family protein [Bowdeniella nasicola]|nr:metallopeptidase family protein [Bowdeniella nasicola]
MIFLPQLPDRTAGRRRDRHGRGIRGPLLPPTLPGWQSQRERFNELVRDAARELTLRYPKLRSIEFAVEDVPPSAPGQYEPHAISIARSFAADHSRGLRYRTVIYRLPITTRTRSWAETTHLVRYALASQCSSFLNIDPRELYPLF